MLPISSVSGAVSGQAGAGAGIVVNNVNNITGVHDPKKAADLAERGTRKAVSRAGAAHRNAYGAVASGPV
jgi:hypothetical protein